VILLKCQCLQDFLTELFWSYFIKILLKSTIFHSIFAINISFHTTISKALTNMNSKFSIILYPHFVKCYLSL